LVHIDKGNTQKFIAYIYRVKYNLNIYIYIMNVKLSKFFLFVSSVSLIFAAIFFYNSLVTLPDNKAYAQSSGSQTLAGYAWSSNIGWVSFAGPVTGQPCGNPDCRYGVTVDSSGNLSGHAWSSNVGWLKFGGLSGFPSSGSNAQFVNGNLIGWARFCAGTTPGDCSSMTSRTDGWDGWVKLNGNATNGNPYGVVKTNENGPVPGSKYLAGEAWGSDVVGWIRMRGINYGVYITNELPPPPQATNVTAVPGCVPPSTPAVVVEWLISSDPSSITVLRNGTPVPNGSNMAGSVRSFVDTSGSANTSYTYVIRTFNSAGSSVDSAPSNSVTFPATCPQTEPPTIGSFTAVPPVVGLNQSCMLEWSGITNIVATNPSNRCYITGPGISGERVLDKNTQVPSGSTPTPAIQATSRYRLTCVNSVGSVSTTTNCSLRANFNEF
jgi:hypothetical protein